MWYIPFCAGSAFRYVSYKPESMSYEKLYFPPELSVGTEVCMVQTYQLVRCII